MLDAFWNAIIQKQYFTLPNYQQQHEFPWMQHSCLSYLSYVIPVVCHTCLMSYLSYVAGEITIKLDPLHRSVATKHSALRAIRCTVTGWHHSHRRVAYVMSVCSVLLFQHLVVLKVAQDGSGTSRIQGWRRTVIVAYRHRLRDCWNGRQFVLATVREQINRTE